MAFMPLCFACVGASAGYCYLLSSHAQCSARVTRLWKYWIAAFLLMFVLLCYSI